MDANVFIYASVNTGQKGDLARNILKRLFDGDMSGSISCLVLDEVFWIVRKHRGKDSAVTIWKDMINIPNIRFLPLTQATSLYSIELIEKYDLRPRDAIHAGVMKENGITKILSDDSDFDRVTFIERISVEDI